MTKSEIFAIAMAQSAVDINCEPGDFLRDENVIVESHIGPGARRYYVEPVSCNFVSYGSNVVASARPELKVLAKEYLDRFLFYHCFETPDIHWLGERLAPMGHRIRHMAEYFLPDPARLSAADCGCELKILQPRDFAGLYTHEWSNALSQSHPERDVLAVGAYDGEKLVGLAGCSADCESMWQIGIDVLPEYRQRGIASALVGSLAAEILSLGKVPFYCAAWSNIRSVRTAINAGFVPAWVEMTVKPIE